MRGLMRDQKYVQGSASLRDEFAPMQRRHSVITAIQNEYGLDFEDLDGMLGLVMTMAVGIAQMVLDIIGMNGVTQFVGDFVVEALKRRLDTSLL